MRLTLLLTAISLFALVPACGSSDDETPSAFRGDGDGDASASGGAMGLSGGSTGDGGSELGTGGSGAADSGWTLDTSTPYGACLNYLEQSCRKRRDCEGVTDEEICLYTRWSADWCPDLFFSEGSNTTIEQVNACADQWSRASCDDVNVRVTPECGFPAGNVPTGQPCFFSTQCAEGYCGGDSFDSCGTCGVKGTAGQACNGVEPPVGCPNGTECTSEGCTPAPEFSLPEGAACERYGQCTEGFWCLENPDGSETCQRHRENGEACLAGYDCGPGLHCDLEAQVCVASPGVGEPCVSFSCGEGLRCNAETICEARSVLGEACTPQPPWNEQSNCVWGYECFCDDGACATGTCFVRRFAGQSCDDGTGHCGMGLECQAGTCVETGLQGTVAMVCGQ